MKKVISILAILMVIACSVFAATGDLLNITAVVPGTNPDFKIYGGKDKNYGVTGAESTAETNIIAFAGTEKDISKESITVYVKVAQPTISKYKNPTGVTLTVTPTALENTDVTSFKTALPTVALDTKIEDTTHLVITQSADNSTKVVTYVVKYPTGAPVAKDAEQVIGTFSLTWASNADLAVGSYKATITLGITGV